MKNKIFVLLITVFISPFSFAAWLNTGWINAEDLDISMDNGKTYFSGMIVQGPCSNNRLELREDGGLYQNPENAKRMFSLILAAKAQGKRIKLGYVDTDGPGCRVAQVSAEW